MAKKTKTEIDTETGEVYETEVSQSAQGDAQPAELELVAEIPHTATLREFSAEYNEGSGTFKLSSPIFSDAAVGAYVERVRKNIEPSFAKHFANLLQRAYLNERRYSNRVVITEPYNAENNLRILLSGADMAEFFEHFPAAFAQLCAVLKIEVKAI
ncbi:MAG: hypothetical protein QXR53_05035 [Candidatus Norongarragalinales archaeon]